MKLFRSLGRWLRPRHAAAAPAADGGAIQGTIERALAQAGLLQRAPPAAHTAQTEVARAAHTVARPSHPEPARDARAQFLDRAHSCAAGTRTYKLYVPASVARAPHVPVPLIVMLHGCKQTPDDFATGTRMNTLADRHGFLVAYPAQAADANGMRCWNWFRPEDQHRDGGEPAILAGIAGAIAADYTVDPRRVFVAGLSAGAAMAVTLGATHPDRFAAVGAHSGLPHGAAHDVASAFAVMRSGAQRTSDSAPRMPTIVFHGTEDRTVAPSNGAAILDALVVEGVVRHVEFISDAGGRRVERTAYVDNSGRTIAEHWLLEGAAHAWSGGSAEGSFTDPRGPDAAAEMVRFFLER